MSGLSTSTEERSLSARSTTFPSFDPPFLSQLHNPNIRTRIHRTKSSATKTAKNWKRTSQNIFPTFEIWWNVGLYFWIGRIQLFILSRIESMSSVSARNRKPSISTQIFDLNFSSSSGNTTKAQDISKKDSILILSRLDF